MARLLSLLLISTLLTVGHSSRDDDDEDRAQIENMGLSKIFSGGTIHLKCIIPEKRSKWITLWYRNKARLPDIEGSELVISNAEVDKTGSYNCKGFLETIAGPEYSPESPSMEITVSAGLVQLYADEYFLVGETLKTKCLVRDNPRLTDVLLYKNNYLIMRQNDGRPDFEIPNVNLTHQGEYSCMANWLEKGKAAASKSPPTFVMIKEVVTEPVLAVNSSKLPNTITLHCQFKTNKRDPAAQVHVYFYRDGKKLEGTARSEEKPKIIVLDKPGCYRCKARLRAQNILMWSPVTPYPTATQCAQDSNLM